MLLLPQTLAVLASALTLTLAAQSHTHGDMVGSVTHSGALVWTRASGPARVSVLYGTTPDTTLMVETAQRTVAATTDFTVKVPLAGLLPATRYWYATRIQHPTANSDVVGPVGTFTTAPDPQSSAAVTFAFSADIRNHAEYAILDEVLQRQPDFYLSLGDFPYADGALTLDDYRAAHRTVRDHATLQRFFRSLSIMPVWDDHEVANDWDATTPAQQVQNGIAAWREYFPIPDTAQETWGSQRWGSAVEIFMLDLRSRRDANLAPDIVGKTMLGAAQKAWLQNVLLASTATFKVVASTVPLRFGKPNKDHWNGFIRERQELLDFIVANQIQNVVFVSGDHHYASVHHHREGVREYQVGPLANVVSVGSPRVDPEVRFRAFERSYGLVRVDPTANPPALHVEIFGVGGMIYRERIDAEPPLKVRVTSDVPETEFQMHGPALFHNSGSRVDLPRVEAGAYRVSFGASAPVDGLPAELALPLQSGADVRIATSWRDQEPAGNRLLLQLGFEGRGQPMTIVDDGAVEGPSNWFLDHGYLKQNSNVHDGSQSRVEPGKLGTSALIGDTRWTDYTVQVRARSADDDAFGVYLRWTDQDHYYRFSMDHEGRYRRLVRKQGAQTTVLAEDSVPYDIERWFDLRMSAVGNRIKVSIDGQVLFDVRDTAHASGCAGLYCWQNAVTMFDDLVVREGDTTEAISPSLFRDTFDDGRPGAWSILDQGMQQAPSLWVEFGGYFVQAAAIHDGGAANSLPMLGTMAIAGQPTWSDYVLRCKVRNIDEDAIGLAFRYRDPNNYYRFSWDSTRRYRRVTKVHNGSWSLLYQDAQRQNSQRWYEVAIEARGIRLRVFVDRALVCDVFDVALATGGVGLYSWASEGAIFDDVVVEPIPRERGVLGAVLAGSATELFGRSPAGRGQPYLLLLSLGDSPGIPLSMLDPSDRRTLRLNADALFYTSLSLSWPGLRGTVPSGGDLAVPLPLPVIPGLSGRAFYCGGLVLDATGNRVSEVLPSVELRFP